MTVVSRRVLRPSLSFARWGGASIAASALCVAWAAAAPPGGQNGNGPGLTPGGQQMLPPPPPIPPVDTTPLTEANTAVTKANADLKKAQAVLFGAARRFEKTIDAKPDVQAATHELTLAQSTLQANTSRVIAGLKSDPTYKDAQEKAKTARDDVAQLRGNADATPDQRYAAAKASLAANDIVSKIEAGALAADPRVTEERAKVAAKGEEVRQLRGKYETALHDDPEWAAANKDVDDKKSKVDAADKQLADARKTVADRQANRAAAVAAQNRLQAQQAAQGGLYGGSTPGVPQGTPPGR
jgi:hypothetical protein